MPTNEEQANIWITQIEAMLPPGLTPLDCDIVREAVSWIHGTEGTTQAQKDRICELAAELECPAPECGT